MANTVAVIEIEMYDDGGITVTKESNRQEAAESGAEGAEPNEVKAKNIEDALQIARDMAKGIAPQPAAPQLGASLRSKPNTITTR